MCHCSDILSFPKQWSNILCYDCWSAERSYYTHNSLVLLAKNHSSLEELQICSNSWYFDHFSVTQSHLFTSIQSGFVAYFVSSSPPSPLSQWIFSPIFLVCYLPLQPGLLWWCEFLHTGCFFQCYFFFLSSRSYCLLSFVLDWLQILCKWMQPLFSLKGWGGEAAVCLPAASPSESARGWVGFGREWTGIPPPSRPTPTPVWPDLFCSYLFLTCHF